MGDYNVHTQLYDTLKTPRINFKIVKELISKGADINLLCSTGHGKTIAMAAARCGYTYELINYIKAGYDCRIVDDNKQNILHHACQHEQHWEAIKYICDHTKYDLNKKNKDNKTPIDILADKMLIKRNRYIRTSQGTLITEEDTEYAQHLESAIADIEKMSILIATKKQNKQAKSFKI